MAKSKIENQKSQIDKFRLQKVLAEAGVASRRECEALIEEGRITVNRERVRQLPVFVDPQNDHIEFDGEVVKIATQRSGKRKLLTLMVYKPKNVICTNDDPEGRTRVIDLVPANVAPRGVRLYPVGRLDADSTGLILLTNDGDLANHLTHPRYEVPKRYRVTVRGLISDEDVDHLRKGLYLGPTPGKRTASKAAAEQVRVLKRAADRTRGDRTDLTITLREGQNREIRRLMARLGFKVRTLQRVAIGPLVLKGLAPGEWRKLTPTELGKLRRAAGL